MGVVLIISAVVIVVFFSAVYLVDRVLSSCDKIDEMHADWFSEDEGDEEK